MQNNTSGTFYPAETVNRFLEDNKPVGGRLNSYWLVGTGD